MCAKMTKYSPSLKGKEQSMVSNRTALSDTLVAEKDTAARGKVLSWEESPTSQ